MTVLSTTLPKRADVLVEFTWKLEDIFPTQEAWNLEYMDVKDRLAYLQKFHGKLVEAETLKACFIEQDWISLHCERLYVYATMRHHQDMGDPTYQALSDKAQKLYVEVGQALSFITPEVHLLEEDLLKSHLSNPILAPYKHTLKQMLHQKAHVLSKEEESLLAQIGNVAQAPSTIFGMINNVDLKFGKIINDQGEEVDLTHGNYIRMLENRNREVRKSAFKTVYATYEKHKNTIAATFNSNVTKNLFYTKVRKYPSSLDAAFYRENIPIDVYTNLIETIHETLPVLHRYMALRKKILKLDELHMFDLFVPIVEEFNMNITYEDAREIIKDSLKPLGKEYLQILQEGFDKGWIDVYENEGKYSGAYSWGIYGTHPYVLLNYKSNLHSMFTLTHEMGHALHTYFANKEQPYRDAQYTAFLGEIASTLNEALLMNYLLQRTNDPKEKMYLLTYYADQFRTTVFRQTMFAEFEKIIHERAEEGDSMTTHVLSEVYYELNKIYYGNDMIIDKDIELEWARIPHFYTSFYVFKYATGFSAATSFVKQILEEGQSATDRYLLFLKSGGKGFPISILMEAGINMSSSEPIRQAMNVFLKLVEEIESYSN
jgi:oligoendopeptidase F